MAVKASGVGPGVELFRIGDKGFSLVEGVVAGICAELDEQEAAALGHERDVFAGEILALHELDQQAVKAFEADGLVLQDCGNVVGGDEGVCEAEHHELTVLRAVHELEIGFEHGDAGGLGADEGAGDVEAVFGKELVEVVAGDAAGDVGEALADERSVAVADTFQAGVDFTLAAAGER